MKRAVALRPTLARSLARTLALAAACTVSACAPADEAAFEQHTDELGIIAPVLGRWLREPVVYRQYLAGDTSAAYGQAWQRWRDLGYFPGMLNVDRVDNATRYSGLWYRDDQVIDWASHRDQLEADYLNTWNQRVAEGFRLIDLDAHTVGVTTRYHSVWIKEQTPQSWRAHRRLSLAALTSTLADYDADGYRPLRINAYEFSGEIRYSAVWVRDGLHDFHAEGNLTSAQFSTLNSQYTADGYVPTDLAHFDVNGAHRIAAIWTRDPRVLEAVVRRELSASQLEEANETYSKSNLVMVDLNVGTGLLGGPVFSALWHRTEIRQLVQSNRPTGGDGDILALGATVAEFSTNGNDGRRGTMGFFIQDLQNGNYLTMNADEPFYLASTSKVLIGARVVSHPNINLNAQRVFNSTDWRGENTRGFTQQSVGQPFPLQTYLSNMLINSDTASTDVFYGILANQDGANGLNDWLRDVVGMQNVGEITDICQVDKRISAGEDTCVFNLSCDTFEAFSRGAGGPFWNATQAEQDCLNGLVNDRSVENHETYYTSLANTVTPAEYGRFWQKFADGNLMDNVDRAAFLATIDPSTSLGFNTFQGVSYDQFATKNGGKRRVASQVGIMWDWAGAPGDYTNVVPRYAFSMFTEDWSFEDTNDADNNGLTDDTDWALNALSTTLASGIRFLAKQ